MKKLDRYKKANTAKESKSKVTSVSVTGRHSAWLKKNKLNLSHIVRDTIDELMALERKGSSLKKPSIKKAVSKKVVDKKK